MIAELALPALLSALYDLTWEQCRLYAVLPPGAGESCAVVEFLTPDGPDRAEYPGQGMADVAGSLCASGWEPFAVQDGKPTSIYHYRRLNMPRQPRLTPMITTPSSNGHGQAYAGQAVRSVLWAAGGGVL